MPWVLSLAPGMLLDQTFEIAATVDLQAQLTPRKALVVFRVGDSGAIQGRDSGCDSEGVKREKRVNR